MDDFETNETELDQRSNDLYYRNKRLRQRLDVASRNDPTCEEQSQLQSMILLFIDYILVQLFWARLQVESFGTQAQDRFHSHARELYDMLDACIATIFDNLNDSDYWISIHRSFKTCNELNIRPYNIKLYNLSICSIVSGSAMTLTGYISDWSVLLPVGMMMIGLGAFFNGFCFGVNQTRPSLNLSQELISAQRACSLGGLTQENIDDLFPVIKNLARSFCAMFSVCGLCETAPPLNEHGITSCCRYHICKVCFESLPSIDNTLVKNCPHCREICGFLSEMY